MYAMIALVTLSLFSLSCAADVSPVEKVITMLEDLQFQVVTEGKAEAKTYDKFACFCKEMSEEKSKEITSGQDAYDDLTAKINSLSSDREELDTDIADLSAKIARLGKELTEAEETRTKEHSTYVELHEEISIGERNLDGATKELKAKMSAVSLLSVADKTQALATLKSAAAIADARGLLKAPRRHARVLNALLSTSAAGPHEKEEYAFQSDEIIETIDDLLSDFKDTKTDLENDEQEASSTYKSLVEDKTKEKERSETSLAKKQKRSAAKTEGIAKSSGDLTATKAVLTDDQAYLKELTAKCTAKSEEWDQRSKMRQDELTAISTAIHIVAGKVSEKTTEKTVRLVQIPNNAQPVVLHDAEGSEEDAVDDIMSSEGSPNFLQLSNPRKTMSQLASAITAKIERNLRAGPEVAVRQRLLTLLKTRSAELNSPTLAMLASKVAADPFVKIKKLIQELIERLLQEAADEANHKGWCDKELGKAKQKRDTKADAVKVLNSEMAENESKRDKLEEDISILTMELSELNDSLSKQSKERSDESAENAATISEAEEGKEAVEQAIDVLDKFYKTAAKAEVFVQETASVSGVDDDMPDTGFKGANKGSQGAAAGILGMLDVILSDFERTISETDKAEKQAAKEYMEFETTTKVSIGTKTVGKETKAEELTATKQDLQEEMDDMTSEQELLDKSIQEIRELQPACVETGMSYEDRVAKREQEIESLKTALCVLGMEGPVQTESGCSEETANPK